MDGKGKMNGIGLQFLRVLLLLNSGLHRTFIGALLPTIP